MQPTRPSVSHRDTWARPRSRRAAPAMPRASAESSWATTWPCNSAFSRTGAGSARLAGKFSRAMACRGKPLHRSSAHSPCETGISSDRLTVHAARLVCGRPKMRVRSRPRWSRSNHEQMFCTSTPLRKPASGPRLPGYAATFNRKRSTDARRSAANPTDCARLPARGRRNGRCSRSRRPFPQCCGRRFPFERRRA